MTQFKDSSVKNNIAWTLASNVLPFLAGLFFFPRIVHSYGLEQFGLLTLAWALIGYFSLFDLGLSRALTQLISSALARQESEIKIAELIRTSFVVMWLLGIFSAILLWLLAPILINNFLKIDSNHAAESIFSFSLLSLAIPFVVHTAALRGTLEALHLFKVASLIRAFLGVGTFLAPFIASYYSVELSAAIISLIVIRIIAWALHLWAVERSQILKVRTRHFLCDWLKPLFRFGGWMSVSNVISPLMVYMDRFLLASVLGAAITAYYVAPYEVVSKMLVIPAAFASVLFPWFAKNYEIDPLQAAEKLNQAVLYTLILLFGPALVLSFFAQYWLTVWLGPAFGEQGQGTVIWLCAGVLTNGVAQILFAKVQGAGLSAWTAKLHLLEVIPYLGLLWFSLNEWGITGAAFAWFVRVLIDLIGLAYFTHRINTLGTPKVIKKISLLLICVGIILIPLTPLPPTAKWILLIIISCSYAGYSLKQLHHDHALNWLLSFKRKY
ncbi:flippase [Polynucleobacter paneuropaeus]|nr:flippase [Polynucleobacter paneuropaeus]